MIFSYMCLFIKALLMGPKWCLRDKIYNNLYLQGQGLHSFDSEERSEACGESVIVETQFVNQVQHFEIE